MNRSINNIDKLANNLHCLFVSYGIKENKLIKIQLKLFLQNEFNIQNLEILELLINDLINEYDLFNENNKNWFIEKSKNIIKIYGGK